MAKRKRLDPARLLAAGEPAPEVKSAGRPPLAGRPPIAEVAQDAAASAALAEVAAELTAARKEGRLVQALPLSSIVDDYLIRDRQEMDAAALAALGDSLRARGQQTPIEVTDLGRGRYGLISGYRRVTALRALGQDSVLALVRLPWDMADAYRAMVEENEIRENLSFWERGRIVVQAVKAQVFRSEKAALGSLFAHVPRARRSKIGSFAELVRALDGALSFPTRLTEKQGLALAQALRADPTQAAAWRRALEAAQPADAEAEAALLARLAAGTPAPSPVSSGPSAPATPAGPATVPDAAPDVAPPTAAPPRALAPDLSLEDRGAAGLALTGPALSDPVFRDYLVTAIRRAVRLHRGDGA